MAEMLGPLILFSLAMSLTPGPNVIMVTASAANFGLSRTVPQILGITIGFGALVLAVAVGLAGLFQAEPRLQILLKYAGAAYLLYLAWCIARADSSADAPDRARPIGAFEAALLQWVNPKGWVLAIGALATFTTGGRDVLWQTSIVGSIITVAVFLAVVVWAAFGAAISRFLGNPRARSAFNFAMAGLLVASLVPVLW